MSFASPLMLLGLLGAAVPILIHLIYRRRPRRQVFPAMELLLASVQRVERSFRLRKFLLLACRVLLLAALALAAAGPLIGEQRDRARALAATGPERVAIVIDASASMRARFGGQSAFDRALAEARERIDRLGPDDIAVLVVADQPPRVLGTGPTADRGALLGALEPLEPGYRPVYLSEAISAAVEALFSAEREEDDEARVLVLSDLAGPAVDGPARLDGPGGRSARIEVVDVLNQTKERPNVGFVSAGADPLAGEAHRLEVRARVQSYDARASRETRPLTLRLGPEAIADGEVEIMPGALGEAGLEAKFPGSGFYPVTLTLPPDALAEDDRHHLVLEVRTQLRVLVVNGDPSGVVKEDEVFYLERALAAGANDQPPPRVVAADDFARTDLEPFDVLVLAGVPSLPPAELDRIVRFVEKGGGLLLTAAEGMDIEGYSLGLAPLLPGRFTEMQRPKAAAFVEPNLDHPVLAPFLGSALGGLLSTKTSAHLGFELAEGSAAPVLLRFSGGAPALLRADAGRGRITVLLTSVDRDLTDLPIRPAFVPLLRQIVLDLGDALSEPDPRRTVVGEMRTVAVPTDAAFVTVEGPTGARQQFDAAAFEGNTLSFSATDVPGHYAVFASVGGEVSPFDRASFAVNMDPVESDLGSVPPAEAELIFRGEKSAADVGRAVAARPLSGRFNPEALARWLLALMGLAFLAESALTARRLR